MVQHHQINLYFVTIPCHHGFCSKVQMKSLVEGDLVLVRNDAPPNAQLMQKVERKRPFKTRRPEKVDDSTIFHGHDSDHDKNTASNKSWIPEVERLTGTEKDKVSEGETTPLRSDSLKEEYMTLFQQRAVINRRLRVLQTTIEDELGYAAFLAVLDKV